MDGPLYCPAHGTIQPQCCKEKHHTTEQLGCSVQEETLPGEHSEQRDKLHSVVGPKATCSCGEWPNMGRAETRFLGVVVEKSGEGM